MCRLVHEFEGKSVAAKEESHQEQNRYAQKSFFENVERLGTVIDEMGNPFDDNSTELIVLDTKEILDPEVAKALQKLHALGKEQF